MHTYRRVFGFPYIKGESVLNGHYNKWIQNSLDMGFWDTSACGWNVR